MSPRKTRRALLKATIGGLTTILAGCMVNNQTSQTGTSPATSDSSPSHSNETDSGTDSENSDTQFPTDSMNIVIHNNTDSTYSVTYEITGSGSIVVSDNVSVAESSTVTRESMITDTGNYEINVSTENGIEQALEIEVEEYDLETGSDIVIWIEEDGIEIGMEE